jgi:predicted RNA methylase
MKRLEKVAFVLRKEKTDYLELAQAIQDYENLVFELSTIEIDNESNRNDIHFENGKALGTTWAALCIRDLLRTKTFIKGLFNAIEYVKDTKKGPVNVIYAGTGPFAALILPIMATYSEEEVQFTLLEVNKVSFEIANQVINKLGFGGFIKEAANEDATKYIVNPDHQIDIVVSETMQHALKREQQVPIVMNIMSQMREGVILIPEKITLDVCLMNFEKFHASEKNKEEGYCIHLGNFFELSSEKIKEYNSINQKENGKLLFPRKSIDLKIEHLKEFNQLTVLTEIQVFGEDRIGINESGLTIPLILEDLSGHQKGLTLNIRYTVNEEPGIEYSWT